MAGTGPACEFAGLTASIRRQVTGGQQEGRPCRVAIGGGMADLAASAGAGRAAVRLAELLAALSLGVDLGFGQPMEHVLRQCLIALRLAERIGLGDAERSVVYYTALLVNVGCHADAHEQAKWFGGDIELRSGKYDHRPGASRGWPPRCAWWAAATRRCTASASASNSRCRASVISTG
jgi:hypothetical protein